LGILDKEGVMRALTVRRVWHTEGELEAGRYLFQQLRYQLREQGNCLGIAYDQRDKLKAVFQVPVWMPLVKARYLVRAGETYNPKRLIYCIAGA
jgi:hypothetical protein